MAENENSVVVKELVERSDAELRSLLAGKREDLHRFHFKHALQQLQETHTIKGVRKDIARLSTVLRQREIAASKEQGNS